MRLIDADALRKSIITEKLTGYNNAIVAIDLAPVIEPKHGRWSKKHNGLRRCSVCKNEVEVREWRNTPLYKYCPYCGAKMDEVDL